MFNPFSKYGMFGSNGLFGGGGQQNPDFTGAANAQSQASQAATQAQTQANRPDINTPWAQQQWTQGPDGQWHLQAGLTGGAGQAANALSGQLANSLGTPFDLSGLPALDSGANARDSAIKAAYGQATSRLDPQWAQRDEQLGSQLANQGLDPNSQAYRTAMQQQGQGRNDAYNQAMFSAIGQGTQAGQAAFQQSLMGRQQALSEALRQRGLPLEELQSLQGLMQTPGFQGAGRAESPNLLGAMEAGANYGLSQQQIQAMQQAGLFNGLGQLGSAVANGGRTAAEVLPFMI